MIRRVWLPILAVATACVPTKEAATPSARVEDSAGIQLVTSSAPAWGDRSQWKVSAPTLTIGGVAGDSALDFLGIVGAHRFGDGTLVVANGGNGQLRWFSGDGRHIRTVGGRGKGPGQFAVLTGLYWLGDTLLAWDGRALAISRFTSTGTFVSIDTLRIADSARAFAVLGAFNNGRLLAEAGVALDVEHRDPGVIRPPRTLFSLAPGGVADSLGTLPGDQLFLSIQEGNAQLSAVPFGVGSRLAVRGNGYVASEGDRPQLQEYDETGRLRRIIRWPASRLPLLQDDIDRQLRELLGRAGTGMQRTRLDSLWRRVPKPDSLPLVVGLVPDEGALAWVRRGGHVADQDAPWWVFDREGRLLGTMMLPARASPLDITNEWIVLRVVDEDRIERIEVRRIRR